MDPTKSCTQMMDDSSYVAIATDAAIDAGWLESDLVPTGYTIAHLFGVGTTLSGDGWQGALGDQDGSGGQYPAYYAYYGGGYGDGGGGSTLGTGDGSKCGPNGGEGAGGADYDRSASGSTDLIHWDHA